MNSAVLALPTRPSRIEISAAVAAGLALVASSTMSRPAIALDARALALGGSAIATTSGSRGVLDNPASLMRLKRTGVGVHLHLGASVDARDPGDVIGEATDDDNQNLDDEVDREIDELSGQSVTCTPIIDDPDTVCLTGTTELAGIADEVLELFDDIDGEDVEAQVSGDLSMGVTSTTLPFAVHLRVVATGGGRLDVSDNDRDYIGVFSEALGDDDDNDPNDDGELTLGEVEDTGILDINLANQTLTIEQPEDQLDSEIRGSALLRTQLGLSFAHTFMLDGQPIDVGITPKFSTLRAGNLSTTIADLFGESMESLRDQIEDSEVEESSFTIDLGASMAIPEKPARVAVVVRNLIGESISTEDGFEFKTTPQVIVGGAYEFTHVTLSADFAINSAEIDNFETQPIALGVEYSPGLYSLRAGIAHDNGRDDDATALTLGFGLGPLQVGARLSSANTAQASAQLSFSF